MAAILDRNDFSYFLIYKKGKRKVQGVPQSQAAALHSHQEEEETNKTKQAQITPMLPNKFQVNLLFCSGEEAK